jgi:Brp/Blh family beta-carotene 15,15'-monooxygenase
LRVSAPELALPFGAAGAVAVLSAFDRSSSDLDLLPWFLGLILLGLPHGACDHLVGRALGDCRTGRFFVLYLAGCGVMGGLWLLDARLALVVFLVLTAGHWGSADAVVHSGRLTGGGLLVYSCVRGTLVVSAPFALWPRESLAVVRGTLELAGGAVGDLPDPLPAATALLTAAVGVELVLAITGRSLAAGLETLVLVGLFSVAEPLLAVGTYFVFWHSMRHVLRTERLLGGEAGWLRLILRYHRRALPLTSLSLVLFLLLTTFLGPASLVELVFLSLVLLSLLTLPHALLVALWDLSEWQSSQKQ